MDDDALRELLEVGKTSTIARTTFPAGALHKRQAVLPNTLEPNVSAEFHVHALIQDALSLAFAVFGSAGTHTLC